MYVKDAGLAVVDCTDFLTYGEDTKHPLGPINLPVSKRTVNINITSVMFRTLSCFL